MLPHGAQPSDAMQLYEMTIEWMPWAVFLLLVLVVLLSAIQPQVVAQSLQSLSAPIQRRYTSGGGHRPLVWLLQGLWELGTLSLVLLVAVAAKTGIKSPITLTHYGLSTAMVAAIVMVKGLMDKCLHYTFGYIVSEKIYYAYRNGLWMVMSMVLWVMLMCKDLLCERALWMIPSAVVVAYYGLLWWKVLQAFGWSGKHIGYSLLYILHLEVLPVVVAAMGVAQLIKL